jgi:hypothetical protein
MVTPNSCYGVAGVVVNYQPTTPSVGTARIGLGVGASETQTKERENKGTRERETAHENDSITNEGPCEASLTKSGVKQSRNMERR